MNIVDTNVLSELTKSKAHPGAAQWLEEHLDDAYVTAITLYEMRYGIERLPAGKRKKHYSAALDRLQRLFDRRILGFGSTEAEIAGRLRARAEAQGFNPTSEDLMIAAIVQAYSATLITRNTKDFEVYGLSLVNPFSA